MNIRERIEHLRAEMRKESIEAFIIFSADPHMSEYLPEPWKERVWITGFTGSAGLTVITLDRAGLWTDGRYYTQAEIELKDSGVELFKDGLEGTPSYTDWIIQETSVQAAIAVNALTTSHQNWNQLKIKLDQNQRILVDKPLLNRVWHQRPTALPQPVFHQSIQYSGKSTVDKISDVRKQMQAQKANLHIISTLDDIAWILNLRGSDVACNPVFLSYLIITTQEVILFVDKNKLEHSAKDSLREADVEVKPYEHFFDFLSQIKDYSILLSSDCNQAIFNTLPLSNKLVVAPTPSHLLKAVKNETELQGFRKVMVKDGVAMVKFLYWLTHQVGKEKLNEFSIGERLDEFRAQNEHFIGVSFGSIIGYQGNGAIIHYSAKKETCSSVHDKGSILIDSGGQYLEGTSDITRTLALGEVSESFKRDYTLVLKGHIRLALAKFPQGTCGAHLDSLARLALWEEGKDYNHGTGHGVGCFLNVHEGPQNIRKDLNPQVLIPGMVISNEPGYYVVGKYGIRHENLVAVRLWKKTEWNNFYEFETLTLCPFFKDSILKELLSQEEINWLNEYHQTCKRKLEPYLSGDIQKWFTALVSPL